MQSLDRLNTILKSYNSLMVAYSGGTDSAVLAWAAWRVLGERALAVIADSPSLPRAELAAAVKFAQEHGIPLRVLQTDEMANPAYVMNDANRCYHCKDELFTQMEALRLELGFAHVAYGMNLDDAGDFRPGGRAANEHNVVAPLHDAGLTKNDVRAIAREAGLAVWDKPASACLSSRIEYGREVTPEALMQVERAEEALRGLGFTQLRVRHHGVVARIELGRDEMPRALTIEMLGRIHAVVAPLGFAHVAIDAVGYRSGSMNAVLAASEIAAAK
jgi:uncharacterized protein